MHASQLVTSWKSDGISRSFFLAEPLTEECCD